MLPHRENHCMTGTPDQHSLALSNLGGHNKWQAFHSRCMRSRLLVAMHRKLRRCRSSRQRVLLRLDIVVGTCRNDDNYRTFYPATRNCRKPNTSLFEPLQAKAALNRRDGQWMRLAFIIAAKDALKRPTVHARRLRERE